MEADCQSALVLVADGLDGADEAAASGDQDGLPVGAVERHGDDDRDGTREVSGELGDEDGLDEGAFVDTVKARRVFGRGDALGPLVGREVVGVGKRHVQGAALGFRGGGENGVDGRLLVPGRGGADGVVEAVEPVAAVGFGLGLGGVAGSVRVAQGVGDGRGRQRALSALDGLQVEPEAEFRLLG